MQIAPLLFPYGYTLTFPLIDNDVAILMSTDKSHIDEWVSDREDFTYTQVSISEQIHYLALKGFEVYDEPQKAKSATSKALYLAHSRNADDGLLLQYMPANCVTSRHYHEGTHETFYSLAGVGIVRAGSQEPQVISDLASVAVQPKTVHQLFTGETESLILIQMRHPGGNQGMSDHIYI